MPVRGGDEMNNLLATVFVYRERATGKIVAEYIDHTAPRLEPEYEHLATLEPRKWIEAHYDEVQQ